MGITDFADGLGAAGLRLLPVRDGPFLDLPIPWDASTKGWLHASQGTLNLHVAETNAGLSQVGLVNQPQAIPIPKLRQQQL